MKDGKNKVHPKENDTFFVDGKSILYRNGDSKISLALFIKPADHNIFFKNIKPWSTGPSFLT